MILSPSLDTPSPSTPLSPSDRALLHAEGTPQPGLLGESLLQRVPSLPLDRPVLQICEKLAQSGHPQARAYLPFFFTAARTGLEDWPLTSPRWLALAFLAGFYLEFRAHQSSSPLPDPAIPEAPDWMPTFQAFLQLDFNFYPRLLLASAARCESSQVDEFNANDAKVRLQKLHLGLEAIDLGRWAARVADDEFQDQVRFALENFRRLNSVPHPSSWEGHTWPIECSVPLGQQLAAQSLAAALHGPGPILLHPLIQACRTRYLMPKPEQSYFAIYYQLATTQGGLDLDSGVIAWLDDALAYAETMIVESPETVVAFLHSLTEAELEEEWATSCNSFKPDQPRTRDYLFAGVERSLNHDYSLTLRPPAPWDAVDQIIHAIDTLVWKRFLDAYWDGEV